LNCAASPPALRDSAACVSTSRRAVASSLASASLRCLRLDFVARHRELARQRGAASAFLFELQRARRALLPRGGGSHHPRG
jgi:hypothetical protein